MINYNILKLISLLITIILISSCTSKEPIPPEKRAIARWNAIINNDWESAYNFQTPNYRKTYSSQTFRNKFGSAVEWKSVKILSVNLPQKHLADIKLQLIITYSESGDLQIPSPINERWQLIDNTWWHIK